MIEAMKQEPDDIELFEPSEAEFNELSEKVQNYLVAMEEKMSLLEAQKEAGSFFRGLFADRSRIAKNQQIVNHLQEYHFLLQNVHQVYAHVTGGMIIKPGYYADQVIDKFEDHVSAMVEQEIELRVASGELFRSWVTKRNPT
jgi:hypothetical protein